MVLNLLSSPAPCPPDFSSHSRLSPLQPRTPTKKTRAASLSTTSYAMALLSTMMVALAAGSAAFGSALPPRIGNTKSAFSVQQVHNPNHVKHGPTALYRAYRKYGASIPENLQAIMNPSTNVTAAASSTGSAKTTPEAYDVGDPTRAFGLS